MITALFDKFLTALEKEVERRNKEFGDQGVNWSVIYPFLRGKTMKECVMVQCDVLDKLKKPRQISKHAQATMSPDEFELNLKTGKMEEIVVWFVDLVTNKARGDLMI